MSKSSDARDELIATLIVVAVGAAVLLPIKSRGQSPQARADVSGAIAVVVVEPPKSLDCSTRGWDFAYLQSGMTYRAHSGTYHADQRVLEITLALDECVFDDGFEP